MAPVNGATSKPPKGSGARSRLVQRPVVPVVPITYPQRSAKPAAAPSVAEPLPNPPHHQPEDEAGEEKVEHATEHGQTAVGHDGHNGHNGKSAPGPETSSATADDPDAVTPSPAPAQTAAAPSCSSASAATLPAVDTSLDPGKRRLPPPFEPASANLSADPALHLTSGTLFSPTQPPMVEHGYGHQAQASNGSLVFGAFPNSGTSSPAPYLSAGFPPTTAPPFPAAEVVPVPVDMYGRPIMVPRAPADAFATAANSHGPPTPHSFHGSQGSNPPEDANGYGSRPVNGHGNYPSEPLGQTLPPPYMHSQALFINHQIQDEALGALRNGLKDPEFADCTLEFRFVSPGGEARDPLTMAAHRFVVAQSPTLRHLLRARSFPHGALQVEVRDEYIRPDTLYFAVRTLYGWDLGEGPDLPTFLPLHGVLDAMGLALGYVAAARYLQLPLVNMKAVHWASRLVRWETVELACKFALPTAALAPAQHGLPLPRDDYPISELLDAIVAFLFSNIPVDFVLDTAAGDCGFARLPRAPSAPPTPRSPNAPAIAHGTFRLAKTHMPRNQRMSANPRLTHIKFGDLAPSAGSEQGSRPGTPTHAGRPPTLAETILSRILLNLPFSLLKQTLEHPVFAKHATADAITRAVVAEREARRLRAMDKATAELHVLQDAVDRAGKPLIVTQMGDFLVNSMGFREEVFAGDAPYLVQTWAQGPSSAGSVGSS